MSKLTEYLYGAWLLLGAAMLHFVHYELLSILMAVYSIVVLGKLLKKELGL